MALTAQVTEDWSRVDRRRGRILIALGVIGFAAAFGVGVAMPTPVSPRSPVICFGGPLAWVALLWGTLSCLGRGTVAVGQRVVDRTDDALTVEGRMSYLSWPLCTLEEVWFEAPGRLRIVQRGGRALVLAGLTEAEAKQLLAALPVPRRFGLAGFELAPATARWPGWLSKVVGFCGVAGSVIAIPVTITAGSLFARALGLGGQDGFATPLDALLLAVVLVGIPGLLKAYSWRDARVGPEGLVVTTLFGSRFIPYGAVAEVLHEPLRVELRDGEVVALGATRADARQHDTDDALASRLAQEVDSWEGAPSSTSLARGDRSIAAWTTMLDRVVEGCGDYRHPAWTQAALVALAVHPAVEPEVRVGAAYALSKQGGERPVRLAAQASVDEDLRRALTEAIAGRVNERALGRATRRWRRGGLR